MLKDLLKLSQHFSLKLPRTDRQVKQSLCRRPLQLCLLFSGAYFQKFYQDFYSFEIYDLIATLLVKGEVANYPHEGGHEAEIFSFES